MKPMTKTQLVAALAEAMGSDKKVAGSALDALAEVVAREVAAGGAVTLPGLGKVACRARPERQVRNPATGETMSKPADKPGFTGGLFSWKGRLPMSLRIILTGFLFSLLWSSAFATARIIVEAAPPLLSLAVRFALSGLIAVGVARALGQSWHLPGGLRGAQARSVIVFGLCQNALYLGLYFIAMQSIEASLAAIIASSMPLIVMGLGWVLRGEKVSSLGFFGLIAGMAGVTLIMGTRVQGGADPFGIMLCVIGATGLAVATLTVRGASGSGNLLMIVGLQMLVGAVTLGVISALTEVPQVTPSWELAAAFIYQIFVPGLAATFIWFKLVAEIGAVRAATFHFLNPFFGVLVAALLLGEKIGTLDILGVAIVMGGILAVQLSRQHGAARA